MLPWVLQGKVWVEKLTAASGTEVGCLLRPGGLLTEVEGGLGSGTVRLCGRGVQVWSRPTKWAGR